MGRFENKECLFCGVPLITLDIEGKRKEPYCYNCEKEIVLPKIAAWKERRRQEKERSINNREKRGPGRKLIKIHPVQVKAARG